MNKYYGLSYTEKEIMDYLWETGEAVTFKELLDYVNTVLEKGWKKQTLSTYLKNLQLLDVIGVDDSQKNYKYYATCTREEHIHKWTQKLVNESFGSSLGKFVRAFSGGKKLSKEEADELRKLL